MVLGAPLARSVAGYGTCTPVQRPSRNLAPWDTPIYSASDVARLLGVSSSTVRAWVFGTSYGPADAQRRFKPVVIAASPRDRTLSFTNLVEIHILTALRREHGVTLPKIRSAITFLGRELGVTHPLARAEMQTDGTDIFIERLGRLLSASQDGRP
jgi:hypothetical protein